MTWIKTILLIVGGLFVLALSMVIVVIVIFDDEDYRRLAIRGVKVFTGTTITIDGEFEVSLSAEPYLSAESIQITSAPKESSISVGRIGKLHVQIALQPLLKRIVVVKKLLIEDVVMAILISDEKEYGNYRKSVNKKYQDVTIPILERVSLRNIQLKVTHSGSGRTVDIALQQFIIDSMGEN